MPPKATGGLLILDETQWYRAEPFSCCSVGIDVVGGIDGLTIEAETARRAPKGSSTTVAAR